MKTIAIANQKDGVGRTTVIRNLVFFAIERDLRVLCVGLDPQRNFSKTLRALHKRTVDDQGDKLRSLTDNALFNREAVELQSLPCEESATLVTADRELTDVASRPLEDLHAPRAVLAKLAKDLGVCIVDTAPTLGNPLYAALIAADFTVCPCTVDQDAIDDLGSLSEDIVHVQQLKWSADLVTLGLLANRVSTRRAFDYSALEQLRDELSEMVMEGALYDRAATQYARDWPI